MREEENRVYFSKKDITFYGDTEKEKKLNEQLFDASLLIAQKDDEIKEKDKEIERLNNIINETRRILGEYRHFSTPTEEQNSENEEIVDKAYIKLHSNLQELKGDSSNE